MKTANWSPTLLAASQNVASVGQDLNTLFKISFGGKKFFHERVFRDLALLKRGPEMILPLNEIKSFDIITNKSNLGK